MPRVRKRKPPRKLDTEQAAALILSMAFRLAENHELCPLCVMDCAIEMMDRAESDGAIHHIADEFGHPTGETAH